MRALEYATGTKGCVAYSACHHECVLSQFSNRPRRHMTLHNLHLHTQGAGRVSTHMLAPCLDVSLCHSGLNREVLVALDINKLRLLQVSLHVLPPSRISQISQRARTTPIGVSRPFPIRMLYRKLATLVTLGEDCNTYAEYSSWVLRHQSHNFNEKVTA
jgi:hypothetical protein